MADGLSASHSPLKNVMGSVRRMVNGPLDLPTMMGDLAGSVFHLRENDRRIRYLCSRSTLRKGNR
jgi:hypothetical protein